MYREVLLLHFILIYFNSCKWYCHKKYNAADLRHPEAADGANQFANMVCSLGGHEAHDQVITPLQMHDHQLIWSRCNA